MLTSDRSIRIRRKLGQAGSCTYHTRVMSPLPLCRIPTRVQNGEYDDDISFHREVHDVGKASKQRAADSGSEVLILEGASGTSRSTRGSASSR